MPCMSYDTEWAHSSGNSEVKKVKAEADKLARIACAAMDMLEKHNPSFKGMNKEALTWYEKHKAEDKKRMDAEAKVKAKKAEANKLRKEALAKLTPEELQAFGIKV